MFDGQFYPLQPLQFMDGLLYPVIGYAPAPVASISSTVLNATSILSTVVIPASAQAGDVAILFDFAVNASGTPTLVVPTDWDDSAATTGSTSRTQISKKILTGADPGATITGLNGTSSNQKVMFVFRPDVPANTITNFGWDIGDATGDPSDRVTSPAAQPVPLIVFGMAACPASTAAFNSETPALTAKVSCSNADLIAGYKIYNSSPATQTIGMADLGAVNHVAAGTLVIA